MEGALGDKACDDCQAAGSPLLTPASTPIEKLIASMLVTSKLPRSILLAWFAFANIYLSEINDKSILPYIPKFCDPVWHLFVIKISNRSVLNKYLNMNGIETLMHYPLSPHLQKAYEKDMKNVKLKVAEELQEKILSLPMGPHLDVKSVKYVSKKINNFF